MQTPESQRKAVRKYDANNTVKITLKLNKNTDADILEVLNNVGNKQGYLKQLIRKEMEK